MRMCRCPSRMTMAAGAGSVWAPVAAAAGSPPCLCCCPSTRQGIVVFHGGCVRATVVNTFCICITALELPVTATRIRPSLVSGKHLWRCWSGRCNMRSSCAQLSHLRHRSPRIGQVNCNYLLAWHTRWAMESGTLKSQNAMWLYAITARLQRPITQVSVVLHICKYIYAQLQK